MKALLLIIILLAAGFGAYWYLGSEQHKDEIRNVETDARRQGEKLKDSVQDKLKDFSLSSPDIKDELERSGRVVRKKAQEVGSAISDATADARITAAIKAKLVKDPNLSAMRISVNTTGGVVTLSGSVDSTEQISQAIKLALETEGVREAISTLQVTASNK